MPFRIELHPKAKKEEKYLGGNYAIAEELAMWREQLAQEAELGISTTTLELSEALDEILTRADQLPQEMDAWKYSWQHLKKAPWIQKIQALWVVLRKRCPPWECRMAMKTFYLLGQIPHEIITYYVIDRPQQTVKFLMFELGNSLFDNTEEG